MFDFSDFHVQCRSSVEGVQARACSWSPLLDEVGIVSEQCDWCQPVARPRIIQSEGDNKVAALASGGKNLRGGTYRRKICLQKILPGKFLRRENVSGKSDEVEVSR